MCGIVALLSRPPTRSTPGPADVLGALDRAVAVAVGTGPLVDRLLGAAAGAAEADGLLKGLPGGL